MPFQKKKETKKIKSTVFLPCFVDLEVTLDGNGEALIHKIKVIGEPRVKDLIENNDQDTLDDIDEKARQAFGYYDED